MSSAVLETRPASLSRSIVVCKNIMVLKTDVVLLEIEVVCGADRGT